MSLMVHGYTDSDSEFFKSGVGGEENYTYNCCMHG